MLQRVFLFAVILLTASHAFFAQTPGIHLIKKTVVGGDGFWDYVTVDGNSRQLFLSHSTQVEVLNADTHEKLGILADTKGVHGVTVIPGRQRVYSTNGRTNTVSVFNSQTLEKLSDLPTGKGPDASLYDPFSKRVFIFNHAGGDITVIDATTDKVVGTIEIGGDLEAGVSDEHGMIYVNVENTSEIAVIDVETLEVKNRYKVEPGEEPTGLAIDIANKRLFTVCGNKLMLVLDAKNGKVLAQLPIGDHCDGVVFDPELKMAISSNGEGTMTVVQEVSPTSFKVAETVNTERGARTIALDPKTHHVFVVTAQYGEQPAPTANQPNPRPKILPGTFMVLEYGQ
jgi:YVTN family beta-propeller protein